MNRNAASVVAAAALSLGSAACGDTVARTIRAVPQTAADLQSHGRIVAIERDGVRRYVSGGARIERRDGPCDTSHTVVDSRRFTSTSRRRTIRAIACGLPTAAPLLDVRVDGERCSPDPPDEGSIDLNVRIEPTRDGRSMVSLDASPDDGAATVVLEARDRLIQGLARAPDDAAITCTTLTTADGDVRLTQDDQVV